MTNAAKVGGLVVVFVALLLMAFEFLGSRLFAAPTDTYYAVFKDAAGVKTGAQVLLAGVKVGEVSDIRLISPYEARMTLAVHGGTQIPSGSSVVIPSSLVGIGDSQISIVPGSDTTQFLAPGASMTGSKASPLDSIMPNSQETLGELTKTIRAFRELLTKGDLQKQMGGLLATSQKTVQSVGDLTRRFDSVIAQNQTTLSAALRNVNSALVNVNEITAQVAKVAGDPTLLNESKHVLSQVNQVMGNVNSLIKDVDKLVGDPKMQASLNQTLGNVADITETGKKIAENTEKITANGAVISEKAIGLTDQVGSIVAKAGSIAEDVHSMTQKFNGILGPKQAMSGFPEVKVGMGLFRETKPDRWRTDLDATIPYGKNLVHVGLRDAFEANRFTMQLGTPLSRNFEYRYGIYGGRAGVGVDYQIASKVSLRGDLWDINDPRLDLRAGYDLGNGLYGWLGVDRMFGDNAASIGIGVRR